MPLTHRYLRQWVKVTNNSQILPTSPQHPFFLIKFGRLTIVLQWDSVASSFLISCVCESCGLRECLSLSYLYFCSELKHAITPGKKEQLASILKTHHKWSRLWKGLLAPRRHAQMIGLGIAIESEAGIWWIVGDRRSGSVPVLMWGGEVLSHEMRGKPCSLIVQINFQTSISLQVNCIFQFVSEVSRDSFPSCFLQDPLLQPLTPKWVNLKPCVSQLRLKPKLVHTVKTGLW